MASGEPYLTNAEIVRAIAANDTGAIWSICQLLADRLSRTYRKDREDLAADAVVRLYRVATSGRLDLTKNVFAYLSQVAINELRRSVGASKKHRAVVSIESLDERDR